MSNMNPSQVSALTKLLRAAVPLATTGAVAAGAAYARRKKRRRRKRRNQMQQRDLEFKAPVSRGRIVRNRTLPSVRIRHREYLQDIDVTASTDARITLALNPGITFPWLSGIANAFEKYRFHSLKFEFVTATATTTTGAIALAPDYDPDDIDFALTKRQLYMFDGVVRGPLWHSLALVFKCPNREFFVREHHHDDSLKWHDPGQLIVDVTSPSVTSTIGELWVEYDITLRIPEYESETQVRTLSPTGAWATITAGAAFTWPLSFVSSTALSSDMGMTPYQTVGSTHSTFLRCWRPGTYLINIMVSGATALTGFSAASVVTTAPSYYGDDDAIVVSAEQVNPAGTGLTYGVVITVGATYNGTFGSYTRDYNHPVYMDLGQMLATAGATAIIMRVAGS